MATCEHLSGDKKIALPSLHFLTVAEGEASPDRKYKASPDEKCEASSDEKYDGKSASLGSVDSS